MDDILPKMCVTYHSLQNVFTCVLSISHLICTILRGSSAASVPLLHYTALHPLTHCASIKYRQSISLHSIYAGSEYGCLGLASIINYPTYMCVHYYTCLIMISHLLWSVVWNYLTMPGSGAAFDMCSGSYKFWFCQTSEIKICRLASMLVSAF